ncbi:MAG: hypothetical protein M3N18_08435 [Actinomycetota bacterium]|nr:hypothetical protein [Actinomycetota bacterium]
MLFHNGEGFEERWDGVGAQGDEVWGIEDLLPKVLPLDVLADGQLPATQKATVASGKRTR